MNIRSCVVWAYTTLFAVDLQCLTFQYENIAAHPVRLHAKKIRFARHLGRAWHSFVICCRDREECFISYVLLTVHHDIIVWRKTNLMRNLFLLYFVNLYMFRAYLGPSSGVTTVCIQHLVLIILFRWLSVVLGTRTTDNRIISTKCCIHTFVPPDDGPRYDRNM